MILGGFGNDACSVQRCGNGIQILKHKHQQGDCAINACKSRRILVLYFFVSFTKLLILIIR
jgi:hypothetical protein